MKSRQPAEVASELETRKIRMRRPYTTMQSVETFDCLVCGNSWTVKAVGVVCYGTGCRKCSSVRANDDVRLPEGKIVQLLKERGIVSLSRCINGLHDSERKSFQCAKDPNHKWDAVLRPTVEYGKCHECAGTGLLTTEKINKRFEARDSSVRMVDTYVPGGQKIRVWTYQCLKCNGTFKSDALNLETKACPNADCSDFMWKPDELRAELLKFDFQLLSDYRTADTLNAAHMFKCLKCHGKFTIETRKVMVSKRCPLCYKPLSGTSKSEDDVRKIIEAMTGWKFPRCRPLWLRGRRKGRGTRPLELDGYNEEHKVAFEYQGPFHYIQMINGDSGVAALCKVRKNDERKRLMCYRRGVTLIRIPHWKKDIPSFIMGKLRKAGFNV